MSLLSVEGLSAAYGPVPVLHGVDLSVDAGEVVTLLGRNGMGKTTTVRTIFGLLAPTAGRITVAGRDMTGAAPYALPASRRRRDRSPRNPPRRVLRRRRRPHGARP